MANSLAEYLISIGFDIKSSDQQKFKTAVREGAFQANVLYAAISGMVKEFDAFVRSAEDGLNKLFIQSRVWQTSATGMAVFGDAAERVGVSTQTATNFLKLFTDQSAKANPLVSGLARNFAGVGDAAWKAMNPTQRALATLRGLSGQSEFVQSNFASQFGLSYEQLKQLENPEFAQSAAHVADIYKSLGLNFDGSSEAAHKLSLQLLDLGTTLNGIATKAAADLFSKYGKDIQDLQQFLQAHGKQMADTLSAIGNAFLWSGGKELETAVHLFDLLGAAAKFIADQLARIAGNKVAQALGFIGQNAGDPFGFGGAINDAAGDLNKDGSFGAQSTGPSDTRNWWERNAPKILGGKDAPANVHPLRASGSLATHQQQAYAAARAQGLSDNAARALVANMSGESLRNPSDTSGDGGNAQGIVQWHRDRAEAIKKQFGKYPAEMTVSEQTRAAIWEMKNNKAYAASWHALNGNGSASDMVGTLVSNYERPADTYGATRTRVGYLNGFKPASLVSAPPIGVASMPAIGATMPSGPGNAGAAGGVASAPHGARDNPWGGLDGVHFDTVPAGIANTTTNHTTHAPQLHQSTAIHVSGLEGGHEELGARIARYQSGLNADLLRSLQGASVG